MVEYKKDKQEIHPRFKGLENEVRTLQDQGVREREIQRLVSTIVEQNGQGEIPIYKDELPAGLVTIKDAADLFGINLKTVRKWVERGRVRKRALLKGSAPGGGMIAISAEELEAWMSSPRDKGGRPKRT